jgi:replicative superfamily II helicase
LTRSWHTHLFLFGAVDLLLLDEVHHLAEDRGATLELVVVRMRLLNQIYRNKTKPKALEDGTATEEEKRKEEERQMRIIALSATLPNISDIGTWLGCDARHVHFFDDTFRPVPLTAFAESFGSMRVPYLFEKVGR